VGGIVRVGSSGGGGGRALSCARVVETVCVFGWLAGGEVSRTYIGGVMLLFVDVLT
jgi:hypothetical protein